MSTDCKNDCKKDWKKIAKAKGLSIPDAALDRVAQSLDTLESEFRPLARALPPGADPAVAFYAVISRAAEDAE